MRWSILAVSLLSLVACSPDPIRQITAPQPLLQSAVPDSSYIVVLRDGDGAQVAAQHGLKATHVYRSALRGFSADLNDEAVAALSRNPLVSYIEPDGVASVNETQLSPPWGLDRIDQRALPLSSSYTAPNSGAGVHAYIIDTGIRRTHNDFGGRAVFGADFAGLGDGDCHGHGTHVAGTVGGSQYGVAKAVTLVTVRVFACEGTTATSIIIAGVDWVTANAVRPAVANMSIGGPLSQAMNDAVSNSIASGVVYAISAGNSTANACNYSPASTPVAITVGATDISDVRASFSNYGTCIDLFAPGVDVLSASNSCDNCTAVHSGTSMAAPHVTGGAALVLAANPNATPAEVSTAMTTAATAGLIVGPGTGSPNLLLFADWTQAAPPPPPAPAPNADFTISCRADNCTFTSITLQDGNWCFSDWERFGDSCRATGVTYRRYMQLGGYLSPGPYTTVITHKVPGAVDVKHEVRCWKNRTCKQVS